MKSIKIEKGLEDRIYNLVEQQKKLQDKLQTLCTGFLIGKDLDPENYVLNLKNSEFIHQDEIKDDS
jgi:hypothetical protein